jgi:septal ring factor EnvC (AmiA/AmiB activator)
MIVKLAHILLYIITALSLSGAALAAGNAPSADSVRQNAETAVKVRANTQKKVEALSDQESDLAQAVEARAREVALLTRQLEKTQAYLKDQRQKLAEMQRKQKELARIKAELEPFLDQTFTHLSSFIENDLPFLAGERAERLDSLQTLLNNYDASLPQKTRRLLLALEIEARYGATAQSAEREIEIAGRRLRVRTLRLGRLGLFAISPDGTQAWRYDVKAKDYEPVDGYSRELKQAADIAQRHRVATLVDLPIGSLDRGEAKP